MDFSYSEADLPVLIAMITAIAEKKPFRFDADHALLDHMSNIICTASAYIDSRRRSLPPRVGRQSNVRMLLSQK